jgi:prophage DNA circulation protein
MSDHAQFEASLPTPYKENWREAYRADSSESPRMASYQAPGGEAIPFIQKSFRFSGGQSKDTVEYPFGGLWSNEYLNEKPQSLTVDGYLRGPAYIVQRNNLIEALRTPTDDDKPGYIDLPFWGRFPVVVNDNYEISETTDEQGQCAVSISFTRAGVSITDRLDALPPASVQFEKSKFDLIIAAINDFVNKLSIDRLNITSLMAGFGQIKKTLLNIVGRIQGAQTILNGITNEVRGIESLINQGVRAPLEFAQAHFSAGMSIAEGILEIKNSAALYGQVKNRGDYLKGLFTGNTTEDETSQPSLPAPDNEKNVLIIFLSADTYTLSEEAATVSQEATITAIENLYRILAFLVSTTIIANMDSLTYKKADGYWRLLKKLGESIN